jgi:hypothetical protein
MTAYWYIHSYQSKEQGTIVCLLYCKKRYTSKLFTPSVTLEDTHSRTCAPCKIQETKVEAGGKRRTATGTTSFDERSRTGDRSLRSVSENFESAGP